MMDTKAKEWGREKAKRGVAQRNLWIRQEPLASDDTKPALIGSSWVAR